MFRWNNFEQFLISFCLFFPSSISTLLKFIDRNCYLINAQFMQDVLEDVRTFFV